MKKQTAVEWLVDKVEDHFCLLPVDLIEQAKEMHKEQIINGFEEGFIENYRYNGISGEEYYNETYGDE